MNAIEFEQQLKRLSKTNGGNFQKVDFHIHSPGSADYEYKGPDAIELLGEVLRVNDYGFAVIVEHQRMLGQNILSALQKHCPKTRLIPGAQINVLNK